jgi:hypothetical protein
MLGMLVEDVNEGLESHDRISTVIRRRADAAPFDDCHANGAYSDGMDAERTIDEIERLERIFAEPDTRPLSAGDLAAANRKHDEMLAHSPWFRLWQQYGVCCRPEAPVMRLPDRA